MDPSTTLINTPGIQLNQLPDEMIRLIMIHLLDDLPSFRTFSRVNKRIKTISDKIKDDKTLAHKLNPPCQARPDFLGPFKCCANWWNRVAINYSIFLY